MIPPMLVPAMQAIGMSSLSNTLRMPIWAKPLAPPPERASPSLGRKTTLLPPKFFKSEGVGANSRWKDKFWERAWENKSRITKLPHQDLFRINFQLFVHINTLTSEKQVSLT